MNKQKGGDRSRYEPNRRVEREEYTNKQNKIAYQINTKGFNKEGQKTDKMYFYKNLVDQRMRVIYIVIRFHHLNFHA